MNEAIVLYIDRRADFIQGFEKDGYELLYSCLVMSFNDVLGTERNGLLQANHKDIRDELLCLVSDKAEVLLCVASWVLAIDVPRENS
jgi:hypothetical protein